MTGTYDISIQRGESFSLQTTVKDGSGNAVDLSGCSVSGVVKLRYSDTGLLLDLQPTITNSASGIISIDLPRDAFNYIPITEALYNIDLYHGDYSVNILNGKFSISPSTII